MGEFESLDNQWSLVVIQWSLVVVRLGWWINYVELKLYL
jgi:hypothetical protein